MGGPPDSGAPVLLGRVRRPAAVREIGLRESPSTWDSLGVRVLFASLPAHGQLLPLASASRDAGHDVVIATGGSFASFPAGRGWAARDAPPRVEHAVRDVVAARPDLLRLPPMDRWRTGLEVFAETLPERTVPPLREVVSEVRPDLVVYEQEDLRAAVVSAAAGVPAVHHGPGPTPAPALLEAFADVVRRRAGDLGGDAPGQGRAVLGVAELDVDVLATVGPDGDVDAVPTHDRLRVERFVDQEEALSRAAAAVHHGGSGTTLASLGYARPQLVMHQGEIDQFLDGRAVVRAALAPEDVSAAPGRGRGAPVAGEPGADRRRRHRDHALAGRGRPDPAALALGRLSPAGPPAPRHRPTTTASRGRRAARRAGRWPAGRRRRRRPSRGRPRPAGR